MKRTAAMQEGHEGRRYWFIAMVLCGLLGLNYHQHADEIAAKVVSFDHDGYWHLLRVQEIHRTGHWDNAINPRGNAPYGERMHWTHAMDLVLWAGAKTGALFTDFDSSLWWWGVFVGPFFYILSLVVLVLFARSLLGPKRVVVLSLLFFLNTPQLFEVYSFNRPDHHCLVAFVFTVYYCLFILLLDRPDSVRIAVSTGLAAAIGLWCGLELLVFLILSLLYLATLWLIQGERYLRVNFLLALSVAAGLALSVILDEKPANYLAIAYDRRSIVHVCLFSTVLTYWFITGGLNLIGLGRTIRGRLAVALGAGVPLVVAFLACFPEFRYGPMAAVDSRLYPLYLDRTGEFALIFGVGRPDLAVYCLLLGLPSLAYVTWAATKKVERSVVHAWLAVTLGVYLVLTALMGRWVYTFAFLTIVPTLYLLTALQNWDRARRQPLLMLAGMLALLVAPSGTTVLLRPEAKTGKKQYENKLVAMLKFLEEQDYTAPGQIVLADIDEGPAIMWHTSLNAVGTLNHNNARGIVDTYSIVTAENDEKAHELIKTRGIDYLLIDKGLKSLAAVQLEASDEDCAAEESNTFIERLDGGYLPPWLIRRTLPDDLAETFTLYQVVGTVSQSEESLARQLEKRV